MSPAIHTLPLGVANAFILKDQGTVLVDCGPPKKVDAFIKQLSAARIEPQDIRLIIITTALPAGLYIHPVILPDRSAFYWIPARPLWGTWP